MDAGDDSDVVGACLSYIEKTRRSLSPFGMVIDRSAV